MSLPISRFVSHAVGKTMRSSASEFPGTTSFLSVTIPAGFRSTIPEVEPWPQA